MWDLDHKALKNGYFQNVVLEKTLESPLDSKKIKSVNPKGNQPWIGRTDAEAEAPIILLPDAKRRLIGKDSKAGKGWSQEEKEETVDEMFEWCHHLNGHKFAQTPGDGEGQGSLVWCSSWGRKELDTLSHWITKQKKVLYCCIKPIFYISKRKLHNLALPSEERCIWKNPLWDKLGWLCCSVWFGEWEEGGF